jgi:Ni,Fe-hydrogenase III small subunit
MAWKKIVVSGSSAELSNINVTNAVTASGYSGDGSGLSNLTIAQVATVTDTFTAQTTVATTHNFDTKNVQVQVYNDSDQLIIPATVTTTDADTVTVTFDSSTSGRVVVAKGGHIVSGSVEFDSIVNKPTLLSGSAQIASDISGSFTSTSASIAEDIANISTDFADITGKPTLLSGSAQIASDISGSFTSVSASIAADIAGLDGDFATDAELNAVSASVKTFATDADTTLSASIATDVATNLASINTLNGKTLVSGSALSSGTQGTVTLTTNGVAANVDTGLQTGDSPTFASLTLTGDLNVTGDTIQAQVTNLNVEDRFILLNSGSNTGDAGIIFGGSDGTADEGSGIFWDSPANVFGYSAGIASDDTTATHTSKLGNIQVASSNPSTAPTFQGVGTVAINDSDEGIWIYS